MARKPKADRPAIGVPVNDELNATQTALDLVLEPASKSEEAIAGRHAALTKNAEAIARVFGRGRVDVSVESTAGGGPSVVIPLTDWHDKSLHPARVGVYKTREPDGDDDMVIGYSRWNGMTWGPQFESREFAEAHAEDAVTPDKEWRGLSEEHPDDAL